jgi:hypothetical protein
MLQIRQRCGPRPLFAGDNGEFAGFGEAASGAPREINRQDFLIAVVTHTGRLANSGTCRNLEGYLASQLPHRGIAAATKETTIIVIP